MTRLFSFQSTHSLMFTNRSDLFSKMAIATQGRQGEVINHLFFISKSELRSYFNRIDSTYSERWPKRFVPLPYFDSWLVFHSGQSGLYKITINACLFVCRLESLGRVEFRSIGGGYLISCPYLASTIPDLRQPIVLWLGRSWRWWRHHALALKMMYSRWG